MIDGSAARVLVTVFALLIGFSAPPPKFFLDKLSAADDDCSGSGTALKNELQSLVGSGFTISLEWALFNPKQGFCHDVLKTRVQLVTAEESLVAIEDSSPLLLNDEHSNTSLDFNHLSFMPPATLDTAPSFSVFSDLSYKTRLFDYSTFVYGDNLELETISLVSESEFKMSFGEFLNSHWTEWTSSKGPSLGLICATVMHGCLLCTILYHLWAKTNTSKALALKLQTLCGVQLTTESQLSKLTLERDALLVKFSKATKNSDTLRDLLYSRSRDLDDYTKHNVHLKVELSRVNDDLKQCKLLKLMSHKRLKQAEDKFKHDRAEWKKTKEAMVSEYEGLVEKYIVEMETEMTNAKKGLDESKRRESETKKMLERKRNEWLNIEKQMMANRTLLTEDRNLIESELLDAKRALERSELLEFEAQTQLILDEENWMQTKETLLKQNTELVDKYTAMEIQLLDTKRALEQSKHKFEAQQKLVLAEGHLSIESEAMKEVLQNTELVDKYTAMEIQLLDTKRALEQSEQQFEASRESEAMKEVLQNTELVDKYTAMEIQLLDTKRALEQSEQKFEAQRKSRESEAMKKVLQKTELVDKYNAVETQLLDTKRALERSELLEFEAQTKLILDEENTELERSAWMQTNETLLKQNTELIDKCTAMETQLLDTKRALEQSELHKLEKLVLGEGHMSEAMKEVLKQNTELELVDKYTAMETQLLDTKRALERAELHKFEAQQKLVLAEGHMNKESEAMKELLTMECGKFEEKYSSQETELQNIKRQLEKYECLEVEVQEKLTATGEALKRKEKSVQALKNVQATEEKLKLANEEIAQLKTRVPSGGIKAVESVISSGGVNAVDSGISSEPDLSSLKY